MFKPFNPSLIKAYSAWTKPAESVSEMGKEVSARISKQRGMQEFEKKPLMIVIE